MKRILVFPGSQRQASLNRQLAGYLAQRLAGHVELDLLDGQTVDLPLFNQDLEQDPAILARLRPLLDRFVQAHAFVVVSPEHNGGVSAYLKNTMDWVSRLPRLDAAGHARHPFLHKPLMLASATSGGSGGQLGMQSARHLFAYLGCLAFAEQISLPYANNAWNQDDILADPFCADYIDAALGRFVTIVNALPAQA